MKINEKLKADTIKLLKIEQNNEDIENAHCNADDIISKLLIELGYGDVIEEYDDIEKWFA